MPARARVFLAAAALALLAVPASGDRFWMQFLGRAMITCIFAISLDLLVGFVDTFGKVFFAEYSGIGVYLLMAVILVWRPEGLMRRGY